jgi:SSS family transporter
MSKKIKDPDDWVVANQSLGIIPLSGTYFATIVSATSIVSYMGYYYLEGWPGMWNFAGTLLTSFIAALWVAKRLRSFGVTTVPEYIELRFGKTHSLIASIIILIGAVTLMSAQVKASVIILQSMVNWSAIVCSIVVLCVFIAFTALGGMIAVAWTDTICVYLIIIGTWAVAIKYLGILGGFGNLMQGVKSINTEFVQGFSSNITPLTALGWTVTWGICNFGAPQFVGRFLSAKSPEEAAKSQTITALMIGIFYIPLLIIGIGGMLIYPGIESQDLVFTTLVTETISPVLGGIMFAAVIAAIISTADSLLLLVSTTFTRDIYKKFLKPEMASKEELKMSRISTVVFGVAGVALAFIMSDVIQFIQARAVTLMGSSIAMLILIGAFNKKITSTAALSSMITGFVVANIWYALGQPYGIFAALPGAISSGIVLLVVSKFTKPMSKEKLAPFFPEVVEEDSLGGEK